MTQESQENIIIHEDATTHPSHPSKLLEVVAFSAGAIVMVFEIVGSRLVAPYLGTSTYIWTSIIGVILGSLSIGYWLGGKLADKRPRMSTLAHILMLAGFGLAWALVTQAHFLDAIQTNISHLAIASLVASLVLFTPASILLGMVTPIAVRLKMASIQDSGKTVGALYAISTVGSIVGTFLAGFYLIPLMGSTRIIFALVLALWVLVVLVSMRNRTMTRSVLVYIVLVLVCTFFMVPQLKARAGEIELDTAYNHVKIYTEESPVNGRMVKILQLGTETHSGQYVDDPTELAFTYAHYYHLARHFRPDLKRALMLGGGVFTVPQNFIQTYPDASIDVLEIDPALVDIAYEHFQLIDDARMRIITEDARIFVARTNEKYDVIFGDAFSNHYSLPYHLTTLEATQELANVLTENGVMITNIVSALEGPSSKFLKAEHATYSAVFPYVYVFPILENSDPYKPQNVMLIGSLAPMPSPLLATDRTMIQMLTHNLEGYSHNNAPLLTDEHAPVDYYMFSMLKREE